MTDTESKVGNKNILENIPTFDQLPNTDFESGTPENKNVSKEKDKINDERYRNKLQGFSNKSPQDMFPNSQNAEQQEEDVPESFFDDFMSEDFMEGLNVVDTWEGEDITRTDLTTGNSIDKEDVNSMSLEGPSGPGKSSSSNKKNKTKSEKDIRKKEERKKKKDKKDKEQSLKVVRSRSRNKEHKRLRRSNSSPSQSQRMIDINNRRDPSKTQRDIQRDKDKCKKDKTTKLLHEKLKVVETGLVPPGMEMEVEMQNTTQGNKLEEGEISDKESNTDKHRGSKIVDTRKNRPLKTEVTRHNSPTGKGTARRNYSPDRRRDYKRIRSRSRSLKRIRTRSRSINKRIRSRSRSINKRLRTRSRSINKRLRTRSRSINKRIRSRTRSLNKRIRSRSRSPKRRYSPRNRSRSQERRIERRRRSPRRTRSRSLDFLGKYKDRSPLRKTSPLLRRNIDLFNDIDALRNKLYSTDRTMNLLSPVPRNMENEFMNKSMNRANMDMVQHSSNNLVPYGPVPPPNQNFIPLQPVPPPQQSAVELDQQFFIGQQPMMESINPYAAPVSQPPGPHNPVMHPEGQQNFQHNWIMEQSQPQPQPNNYFNQFNMDPNNYQPTICPPVGQPMPASVAPPMVTPVGPPMGQHPGLPLGQHSGPVSGQHLRQYSGTPQSQHSGQPLGQPPGLLQFMGNNTRQEDVPMLSNQKRERTPPIPVANMDGLEDELFAKMFADNKITLSDYLSVTAKSTDNSSPGDVQNKVKVISHCQDALNELTGNTKSKGKFVLRKSQKSINKSPTGDGLSPFKKVPAIKFQFTTYVKQSDEQPQLATYLNRLMYKLHKDVSFQERVPDKAPPASSPKIESIRESRKSVPQTVNVSVQTEPVGASDFGCQVSFDDVAASPMKSSTKNQSLAKLTPAQLLAQAENEASPPPAPRWSSFVEPEANRRNDNSYWNFENVDSRRNMESNMEWSRMNAAHFFDRSLPELQDLFHGKRY